MRVKRATAQQATGRNLLTVLFVLLQVEPASAHSFGVVYTLPVPFWLYAWGASAALLASFMVVGFFFTTDTNEKEPWSLDLSNSKAVLFARRWQLLNIARAISFALFILCILSGFFGTQNAYYNFNMTFFWVIFLLGFTYFTMLAGDWYAPLNPWLNLANFIDRVVSGFSHGRISYPQRLGYWPAVIFYGALIWLELFSFVRPHGLSMALSLYTAINLFGIFLIGSRDWFQYCEVFSVFFRLIALMAPVDFRAKDNSTDGCLKLRLPFSGLMTETVPQLSLLVFILFMLSSTAFDGLHETRFWKAIFWRDLYINVLQYHSSSNPLAAFPQMRAWYVQWQIGWLWLSPWIYLLIYWLFIALMKWVTRSKLSVVQLTKHFGLSLLPIALVYNIAHYFTLLDTQGVKIVSLVSDPFGWHQNWFGTAGWFTGLRVPDLTTVWHTQVGLIVFGHIVSVYFAHKMAVQVFPTRKQAVVSQLPMLVLMVLFTTAGLWILSLPLISG